MEYTRTIIAFLMLITASSFAMPLTVSELAWPKIASSSSSGLSDLTNGLVAYYRFDTNNGASAPFSGGIDYSGNLRNLTAYGTPTYETGVVNTVVGSTVVSNSMAINADGFFAISNTAAFNFIGDHTIAVWVLKRENPFPGTYHLFGKSDPSNPTFHDYVLSENGVATSFVFSVSGVGVIETIVPTNQWLFVIAEYQHTNAAMTLQINMGAVLTFSGGPAGVTPAYSNWFGSLPAHAGSGQRGLLDELSIWDRLLFPFEKTNLYNLGSGRTYPFSP